MKIIACIDRILNFENITNETTIYPNPIESIATIKGAENTTMSIYDINGRILLTKNVYEESEIIDLSDFVTDIYYAEFNDEKIKSIFKIIKQ